MLTSGFSGKTVSWPIGNAPSGTFVKAVNPTQAAATGVAGTQSGVPMAAGGMCTLITSRLKSGDVADSFA